MQPEWAVAQVFTGVCDQKRGFKEGYLWLGLDSGQLQQQVIKNKCCQIKTLKTVVSQLPKKHVDGFSFSSKTVAKKGQAGGATVAPQTNL